MLPSLSGSSTTKGVGLCSLQLDEKLLDALSEGSMVEPMPEGILLVLRLRLDTELLDLVVRPEGLRLRCALHVQEYVVDLCEGLDGPDELSGLVVQVLLVPILLPELEALADDSILVRIDHVVEPVVQERVRQ